MAQVKQIKTISGSFEAKYKEKGSTFISKSFRINSLDEAEFSLSLVKKEYYDANHHCFAFRLLNESFKYSDDGEPNGTAGIRILNAIDHFNLTNVLIVVTRYFGGTKLGVGPLGKAYYKSAYQSINLSKIITLKAYKKILITSELSLTNHIYKILAKHNSIIKDSTFDTKANIECLTDEKNIKIITNKLNEISKGKIRIDQSNEVYFI